MASWASLVSLLVWFRPRLRHPSHLCHRQPCRPCQLRLCPLEPLDLYQQELLDPFLLGLGDPSQLGREVLFLWLDPWGLSLWALASPLSLLLCSPWSLWQTLLERAAQCPACLRICNISRFIEFIFIITPNPPIPNLRCWLYRLSPAYLFQVRLFLGFFGFLGSWLSFWWSFALPRIKILPVKAVVSKCFVNSNHLRSSQTFSDPQTAKINDIHDLS